MSNATVVIQRADDYQPSTLRRVIAAAIEPLGGWSAWIKPGDRVLVKPNLISGAPVSNSRQTHPAFVAEVCRQLIDFGAKPFVGDSPAWSTLASAARKSGLADELRRLDVPLVKFNHPVRLENGSGRVHSHLTIDQAVVNADVVVNLPKLKAHCQLYLTLAIKNLFGCVTGKRKAWWHMTAGDRENCFAEMLCEVCALVNPAVTILDGIIAMEGNGPCAGNPRPIGAVLVSTDVAAIERVACEIIQADPRRVRTLRAAEELGFGTTRLDQIETIGESIDSLRVKDFVFPDMMPIRFSPYHVMRSVIKNFWLIRRDNREARRATA